VDHRRAARADGHAWRARACAVLTGIGTVRRTTRGWTCAWSIRPRQPPLVVVDSRLETPLDASCSSPAAPGLDLRRRVDNAAARAALQKRGARCILLPGPGGKVDLAAMLRDLAGEGVNELHVEAGHKLNGSLLREGLVDELLVYLAPR
jgi:diaminohydroxyphosphoribosylaminopyrimidine deaminase/5-amino-6-(5-phosphoribosylamino)uracil reductase